MQSSPAVANLLENIVLRFAGCNTSDRGSLARALKNSAKLFHEFSAAAKRNLNELADITKQFSQQHFSFAAQRWDSTLSVLRLVALRVPDILQFLCQVSMTGDKNARWAQKMLKVFDLDSVLLLGLVCELMQAVQEYTHAFDNKGQGRGGQKSWVCRISHQARLAAELRQKLDLLFNYGEGGSRVPLCINPAYQSGYVQSIVKLLQIGNLI